MPRATGPAVMSGATDAGTHQATDTMVPHAPASMCSLIKTQEAPAPSVDDSHKSSSPPPSHSTYYSWNDACREESESAMRERWLKCRTFGSVTVSVGGESDSTMSWAHMHLPPARSLDRGTHTAATTNRRADRGTSIMRHHPVPVARGRTARNMKPCAPSRERRSSLARAHAMESAILAAGAGENRTQQSTQVRTNKHPPQRGRPLRAIVEDDDS